MHFVPSVLRNPRTIAMLAWCGFMAVAPTPATAELFSGRGFEAGFGPHDLVLADFDGDGVLDAALPGRRGDHVAFLPGLGDGTFGAAQTTSVGSNPVAIDSGDLDGDGNLDVVTADFGDFFRFPDGTIFVFEPPSVSVLLGNGDGTFIAAAPVNAGAAPSDVVVADLNGDGIPDLVVADALDSELSILLGNGDGSFQAAAKIATAAPPGDVYVAEVNGDGALDLVLTVSGDVVVLEGNGDGSFIAGSVLTPTAGSFFTIEVVDVDGDGPLDVVVIGSDGVEVFLGNGDGTFAASGGVMPVSWFPMTSAAGDLNADGHLDLAVISGSVLTLMLGNGDGTFDAGTEMPVGGMGALALEVVDADANGTADLLAVSAESIFQNGQQVLVGRWLRFFPGLGGGRFGSTLVSLTPPTPHNFLVAVESMDVNGDSHADLVTAMPDTTPGDPGWVGIQLGNGDGTFKTAIFTAAGEGPDTLILAHLDGDTSLDVLVTNVVRRPTPLFGVSILLGLRDGVGGLAPAVFYPLGAAPSSMAVGDLDGAGGIDVVVARSGGVDVLLGTGDGTLGTATSYAAPQGFITDIVLADFDGDGPLDAFVVYNSLNSEAAFLAGNGDGSFAAAVPVSTGAAAIDVAAADLDASGSVDIVIATAPSEPGADVRVLLGNGDGTFGAPTVLPTPLLSLCCIELRDIDGDGRLDIVVGGNGSDVIVLTANGDGSFTSNGAYAATVLINDLAVADFDGDGQLEIATAGDLGTFIFFGIAGEGVALLHQLTPVPEPATGVLMTISLIVVIALRARREA